MKKEILTWPILVVVLRRVVPLVLAGLTTLLLDAGLLDNGLADAMLALLSGS